jgi:uncharacterized protein YjdB
MVKNASIVPKLMGRWFLLLTTVALAVSCGGLKKAKLTDIKFSTQELMLKVGTSMQVPIQMSYEGPRGPLPPPVPEYSSSDPTVATITKDGVATGVKVGTTTITARLAGKAATTSLKVTPGGVPTSITVEPANPRLIVGATLVMVARAFYSDGTNAVVSDASDWTSSDETVAKVSTGGGARGVLVALKAGSTRITAKWQGFTGDTTVMVTAATVKSLAVDPPMAAVARGAVRAFKAIATLTDNTTLDVTTMSTWTSSANGIATVTSGGVATGVAQGVATITATFGTATATARLTVTNVLASKLTVTPAMPSIPLGATEQLTAVVQFVDNTTQDVSTVATWTSLNTEVATVDATGKVTAKKVGTSTITAKFGDVMGTALVTVTDATVKMVTVTAPSPTVPVGLRQQYTATAVYTDGSNKTVTGSATWETLNVNVARVSNLAGSQGLLTAVAAGTTMVTARYEGVVGSATVQVTAAVLSALAISPANERVALKGQVKFFARGLYSDGSNRDLTTEVAWSSSMPTIASISNADGTRGYASALAVGDTTIQATLSGITQSTTLTVTNATLQQIQITPVTARIAKGTTTTLIATGIYSDASHADLTDIADWTSSATGVATVTTTGLRGKVAGITAGMATVTASFDGKSTNAVITVTNATLVSLSLTPLNRTVPRDFVVKYSAAGVFSDDTFQDLTDQVTWASSMPNLASISNTEPNNGRVVTLLAGTTTISAQMGAVTASTTLTITNATLQSVAIAPASSKIAKTTSVSLVATGTYSDATSYNITELSFWSSNMPQVATVSIAPGFEGRVTGVMAGTATISAVFFGKTGTASVEVTNATLMSLDVQPATATVGIGTEQRFTVTGTFSDATTQPLTDQATWTSSDRGLAEVYNSLGDEGRAVGIAAGNATITATIGTVSDTAALTISASPLASISVSPANPTITVNGTQQFTATGQLMDGTPVALTALATWTSTNVGAAAPAVAQVSNNADHGLATGLSAGQATIKAIYNGITGMATLNVNNATLVSIDLTPATATIGVGGTQQYTVRATYSDGEVKTVTAMAAYTLQNGMTADGVVSIAASGLATGLANGMSTITATFEGKTDTATLTVNTATLQSIRLVHGTPEVGGAAVLPPGISIGYRALGTYSDMTERDVTALAMWSSSMPAIASLAGNGTATVTVSSLTEGMTTITAAIGAISGTSVVTVLDAVLDSLSLDPSAVASLPKGSTQRLRAIAVFRQQATGNLSSFDLSESSSWMTSDAMKATVDITAGNKGIVTAGNTTGAVTITASLTVGGVTKTAMATVTVTNEVLLSLSISTADTQPAPRGILVTYTATGTYTNGARAIAAGDLTWSADDTNIADPQAAGQFIALNVGTTTVRATTGGIAAMATFNVTNAVVDTVTIAGPAFLDATHKMAKETKAQLTATARYTDFPRTADEVVTTLATWMVDQPTRAQFAAQNGIIEALMSGAVTVSATYGGKTGTYAITVTDATIQSITVSRNNASLAIGASETWTATGTFFDPMAAPPGTSTQPLDLLATWVSGNPAAASVSNVDGNRGFVQALAAGAAFNITAFWNGVQGSNTLTVTGATLVAIELDPPSLTLQVGQSRRFTATARYSDNTTVNVSNSPDLTWSLNPNPGAGVATISAIGTVQANGVGSTSVRATWNGTGGPLTGDAPLTIANAPVTSVTITAIDDMGVDIMANPGMMIPGKPVGVAQRFRAVANHPGGGSTDVTNDATWSTDNANNATAAAGGFITGVLAGSNTNVTAIYQGVTSNAIQFFVTGATLQSITVSTVPAAVTSTAKGNLVQFKAFGNYSDGSAADLTAAVNWSGTGGVAVQTGGMTAGQADTSGAAGPFPASITITATDPGTMISANRALEVRAPELVSIAVTPAGPTINGVGTQQFQATGTYTDGVGAMGDLTGTVTWTSSNAAAATISNAAMTKGLATSKVVAAPAMTTITAIDVTTGKAGSTTLTVNP